jgi:hypothetical protein
MIYADADPGFRWAPMTPRQAEYLRNDAAYSEELGKRLNLRSTRPEGEPKPIPGRGSIARLAPKPVTLCAKCVWCDKPVPEGRRAETCSHSCSKALCRQKAKAAGKAWAVSNSRKRPVPLSQLCDNALRIRTTLLLRKLAEAPTDKVLKIKMGILAREWNVRRAG